MHTVSFFSILFIKVVSVDVVVISISLLSFFYYYFLITVSLHFLSSELLITLFIKIIPKHDIIGEIRRGSSISEVNLIIKFPSMVIGLRVLYLLKVELSK